MSGPEASQALTLYPPPFEKWWAFLICLAFAAIGVWMVADGAGWKGWLVLVVFGLGVLVLGATWIFRKRFALRLTPEGFHVVTPFRSDVTRWEDVAEFGVWRHKGNRMVSWRLTESAAARKGAATTVSRAMSGYDGALSSNFGMKAEALAALLEERRRGAL